jgi:hypothetical protein
MSKNKYSKNKLQLTYHWTMFHIVIGSELSIQSTSTKIVIKNFTINKVQKNPNFFFIQSNVLQKNSNQSIIC